MNTLNLNFNGTTNIVKSICWIISVLSWIFMLIVGWISISYIDDSVIDILKLKFNISNIWNIYNFPKIEMGIIGQTYDYIKYIPCQINELFLYITFITALIFATFGFFIYFCLCTFKKDSNIMNGMLDGYSKFHFIPIICIATLFLIGILLNDENDKDKEDDYEIASFIFSVIGLFSLIIISYLTKMESPWYGNLFIKKGTYGSFIALLTYNVCYSVYRMGIDNSENGDEKIDFRKNCGIGITLSVGIFNLLIAYFLKDYILAAMNLLIYIGATLYFFDMSKDVREEFNDNADGIIDIIMIVLSAVTIGLILFLFKPWTAK